MLSVQQHARCFLEGGSSLPHHNKITPRMMHTPEHSEGRHTRILQLAYHRHADLLCSFQSIALITVRSVCTSSLTMNTSDHILVVDDDPEIRQLLSDYLQTSDYRVSTAAGGKEMRQVLADTHIDLIVLDVMMPDEDGITLCRELRTRQETPVIMLTARGSPLDRIVGLEVGADDYMPKPFDPRELVARIKSVLKRARSYPVQTAREEPAYILFSGWQLDTRARQLQKGDGPIISLGSSDYMVLRTLLDHANRPLSREYLLSNVYNKENLPFDRSIDVCVSRLRQHLEENPRHPTLVRTVRNTGYMLTTDTVTEQ